MDLVSTPGSDPYLAFLTTIRARFAATAGTGAPLFTTDATGLFEAFLLGLPEVERPIHTCSACRRFVEGFGGLVAIRPDGGTVPVMWDPGATPELYRPAVEATARLVSRATVTGVFHSAAPVWGRPVTGEWQHMAVTPPASLVFQRTLATAGQVMAQKREDFATLSRGLVDFPKDLVVKAHTLLTNGALYRSEKCEGVAAWLRDLHVARAKVKGAARENVTWLAVATAPPGFCHVRSTMIGTLLEDLAAELPFERVKSRFDAKTHPLQYQRPTAAPSAGNIAQAEKIVATLGSAGALARRFAKREDIVPLWEPAALPKRGGVFGHLKAKMTSADADMPPVTITWEKFARTVLPSAAAIECWIPVGNANYYGLVTAANTDAPPIVQWDRPERRNPVTWYTYPSGATAKHWNLTEGRFHPVTAVTLLPFMWDPERSYSHQGDGVVFVLDGARDTQITTGAGFFPEQLKSEYHGIRATLEAYARAATIAGRDEATACGLGLRKGQAWDTRVRVTPRSGPGVVYRLDRWD